MSHMHRDQIIFALQKPDTVLTLPNTKGQQQEIAKVRAKLDRMTGSFRMRTTTVRDEIHVWRED